MWLAHVGIGVTVIGITLVKGYEQNLDVKMATGDTAHLAGYSFAFKGVTERKGPNFVAASALIEVTRDDKPVATMRPEKRMYTVQQMPMTEGAIDPGFTRDLYVSMGEPLPGSDAWIVRIFYKPFVGWIWWGAILMGVGGLIAAADRRYRRLAERAAARRPAVDAAAAPAAAR